MKDSQRLVGTGKIIMNDQSRVGTLFVMHRYEKKYRLRVQQRQC